MTSEVWIGAESRLVCLCIDAASQSGQAVEAWRRQRRSLERLPSNLAAALFHRLLRRRLLVPSLLELFKYSIEEVDLKHQSSVDAEWIAYLGGFRYLSYLNLADCNRITNSAIWPIAGVTSLKEVDISRCSKVSDAGIRHLLSIPSLERLHISETGVTAGGISLLASLTSLCLLDLGGLPVTDAALCSLKVLTRLEYLDLWGSEVSNQGVCVLNEFPVLSFLNLAWTRVTVLPNLPSLSCLNMSNCTIHSIFGGAGDKPHLEKLILSGATYNDVSEALLYVETSSLSLLDMSNSSLGSLDFLTHTEALKHLDLSSCSIDDNSVELIAKIGANLQILNLGLTKVTSAGVGVLAGNVPLLQNLSLSGTQIDDTAFSYLSMMPSLKIINLSKTKIKGLILQEDSEPRCVSSLTRVESLVHLEWLDLEETQIRDEALHPLLKLPHLTCLYLRSSYLTDESLHLFSSVTKLTNLSFRDGVLTNAGLGCFNPPSMLKTLDLRGCWLLTEEALFRFCKHHPGIEVKHEHVRVSQSDPEGPNTCSPSRGSNRTVELKKKQGKKGVSPLTYDNSAFLDQRLKYSREELMAFQFPSSSSPGPSTPQENIIS